MSLEFETQMTAYKLLREIMTVKKGETVAIYSDTASDEEVVKATASAAMSLGATPIVVEMPTDPKVYGDYPRALRELLKSANVVVEMGGGSVILYTSTYEEIVAAKKARFICLSYITKDLFLSALGRIDVQKTLRLGERMVELTNRAKKIRITSPAGTDVAAQMSGRKANQSGRVAKRPGEVVMLLGQVGWCPIEESINGSIVIDGVLDKPKIGTPSSPIRLSIKRGKIVDVQGGADAMAFKNWLDSFKHPNIYNVAHYTYGLNPGILEFSGKSILTDERQFGGFLFGFGHQGDIIGGKGRHAPSHADGVCMNPSVWLDDLQIEKEGKWIHPDLVRLCKEMKIPGY